MQFSCLPNLVVMLKQWLFQISLVCVWKSLEVIQHFMISRPVGMDSVPADKFFTASRYAWCFID